jgi:hypothetical protein
MRLRLALLVSILLSLWAVPSGASVRHYVGQSFQDGPYRVDVSVVWYNVKLTNASAFGIHAQGQLDAVKLLFHNTTKIPHDHIFTATVTDSRGRRYASNDMAGILANTNVNINTSIEINPGSGAYEWFIFDLPKVSKIVRVGLELDLSNQVQVFTH